MQITRQDVINIVREIVRLWPYEKCTQPDTFAVVDNVSDLESDNLGKVYNDYMNGHFWSRSWVLSGASRNKLNKKYPIVILEQKNVSRQYFDDADTCWEWWFVIADIPDCISCGDCNRSKDTIDTELQHTALKLIEYISHIKLYKFDADIFVWTTAAQAQKYIDDEVYDSYEEQCGSIVNHIQNTPFQIRPGSLGLTDAARSVIFSLTVCSCVGQPMPLTTFTGVDIAGETKCKTC